MFDSVFDEPWMDFSSALGKLSDGIYRFSDTKLYTILKPDFQRKIDEASSMAEKIVELKNLKNCIILNNLLMHYQKTEPFF